MLSHPILAFPVLSLCEVMLVLGGSCLKQGTRGQSRCLLLRLLHGTGPIVPNKCKKSGSLAQLQASSVLLCRGAGRISHEVGEGWWSGNRNYLNIYPPFQVGVPGTQPALSTRASHPPPKSSFWDRWQKCLPCSVPLAWLDQASRERSRVRSGRRWAVPPLTRLSRRPQLRSPAAPPLSQWHAPVPRSFHPSLLNAASP